MCICSRKYAVGQREEKIGDEVADIIAHGAVEAELRVENTDAGLIGKDRACVEIAVQQRLRVVHKSFAEDADFRMERTVFIELLFYKVFIAGREDIASFIIIVWFGKDQVLGDPAKLRIRVETDKLFLFFRIKYEVGRGKKGVRHETAQILCEVSVDPAGHQLLTEVFESGDIFHRGCCHGLVISVDGRDVTGRKLPFKLQKRRLDPVPADIERIAGSADAAVSLFYDQRSSVGDRADTEDIVNVAVPDLFGDQSLR